MPYCRADGPCRDVGRRVWHWKKRCGVLALTPRRAGLGCRRRGGMESALNATFEVLSFGAVLVLVVLGLGIIAGMMGIFNFAHGDFVLLGAYTTYLVYSVGLPVWLGMFAAPLVVAAIGFVLERVVIRRFYAIPVIAMVATYALGLIIREGVRGLIGGLYLSVPEPIVGSFTVAGAQFSRWRLAIVVCRAIIAITGEFSLRGAPLVVRELAAVDEHSLLFASGVPTSARYAAT